MRCHLEYDIEHHTAFPSIYDYYNKIIYLIPLDSYFIGTNDGWKIITTGNVVIETFNELYESEVSPFTIYNSNQLSLLNVRVKLNTKDNNNISIEFSDIHNSISMNETTIPLNTEINNITYTPNNINIKEVFMDIRKCDPVLLNISDLNRKDIISIDNDFNIKILHPISDPYSDRIIDFKLCYTSLYLAYPRFSIIDEIYVNEPVLFENTSRIFYNYTMSWNFGDGTNSSEFSPTHIYLESNYYTVTLTITCRNQSFSISEEIYIRPKLIANFETTTTEVALLDKVLFTNLSSGDILKYTWQFEDHVVNYINTDIKVSSNSFDDIYISDIAFYISPDGNDDDSGSIDSPWASWEYAAIHAPVNSTVYFREGTYTEENPILIYYSTSITFKNYPNENPIIISTCDGTSIIIGQMKDYIRIEGLQIRKDISSLKGNLLQISGSNCSIINCILSFNNNVTEGYDVIKVTGESPISNLLVEGCEIYGAPEQGIDMIIHSDGGHVIRNNTIHSCQNAIVIKGGTSGVVIENNISYNHTYQHFFIGGSVSEYVWNTYGPYTYQASNIDIRNNICHSSTMEGIYFMSAGNCRAYNNTFYCGGIKIDQVETYLDSNVFLNSANLSIKNNILYKTVTGPALISMNVESYDTFDIDYNIYYSNVGGTHYQISGVFDDPVWFTYDEYKETFLFDVNSIYEDPLFINVEQLDFHLSEDSPCINSGTEVGLIYDFENNSRIDISTDIGAYEFKPNAIININSFYVFTDIGKHTVSLTVEDIYGNTDTLTRENYINVIDDDFRLAFSIQFNEIYQSTIVYFINVSQGDISSYLWDFGDGYTSTDLFPNHTYSNPGVYLVTLKAYNLVGELYDTEFTKEITVHSVDFTTEISGNIVTFTNTSDSFETCFWEFGDDHYSRQENPIHEYVSPRNNQPFHINLVVTHINGLVSSILKTIYVDSAVKPCNFKADRTDGIYPVEVTFNYYHNLLHGNIISYEWDFGNGTTSTDSTGIVTYTYPGRFTVSLTLQDDDGITYKCIKESYINIDCIELKAFFTFEIISYTPFIVQFNNESSGNIAITNWTFGDGLKSNRKNPQHEYFTPGYKSVSLQVIDSCGKADTITIVKCLYVPFNMTVDFIANTFFGINPVTVSFTNRSVGPFVRCEWDFGDGSISNMLHPIHTYHIPGNFIVTLTIYDENDHSYRETKLDYIIIEDPIICEFSAETTIGVIPLEVQFNNLSTGPFVRCLWDFGDGNTSTDNDPIHTYPDIGVYNISLTVYHSNDTPYINTKMNYINAEDVTAEFTATPVSGEFPLVVSFQNLTTGPYVRCVWEFGDGTVSSELNPTHTYLDFGKYTVSLISYYADDSDYIETKTDYIDVGLDNYEAFLEIFNPDTNDIIRERTFDTDQRLDFRVVPTDLSVDWDNITYDWGDSDVYIEKIHAEVYANAPECGQIFAIAGDHRVYCSAIVGRYETAPRIKPLDITLNLVDSGHIELFDPDTDEIITEAIVGQQIGMRTIFYRERPFEENWWLLPYGVRYEWWQFGGEGYNPTYLTFITPGTHIIKNLARYFTLRLTVPETSITVIDNSP